MAERCCDVSLQIGGTAIERRCLHPSWLRRGLQAEAEPGMGEPTGTAYPAVAPVIDAGQWHSNGRVDNKSDPELGSWAGGYGLIEHTDIIHVRA